MKVGEPTAFFILKVKEEDCRGQIEWRGELFDVDSGEKTSFEDWPDMVEKIADSLHRLRPAVGTEMGKH